jgi:epoxyqueuosine reductase
MSKISNTKFIKTNARLAGFDYCGIARAVYLQDDARRLEKWIGKGMNGTMQYMENHFELRVDPTKLVPGAKSVITLLLNYFPAEKQNTDAPKISKYAFGNDYHEVIREKLNKLLVVVLWILHQCWNVPGHNVVVWVG